MRIALGVRRFCLGGGQEQFAVRLAQHLVGSGHAVIVYTFEGDPIPGVELHRISPPRFRPRCLRDWATGKKLAMALAQAPADVTYGEQKTWNVDVIRAGGGVEAAYWDYALQRKWKRGYRWLARICPKRFYDIRAEKMALLAPTTKTIVVNAHLVAQAMHKAYPQIDNKIRVIHNGANMQTPDAAPHREMRASMRRMLGIPEQAPVMLFVGHDFYRKGLDAAIQVLSKLRVAPISQPWHLIIAGRGDRALYQLRCLLANVRPYAHFVKRNTDCACMYAAADVLVLPSHYDPFANVTVEALAAGIPVLTTRRNGGSEVIVQAKNGWVIDTPYDISRMVDILSLAIQNTDLLAPFKQEAARSVTAHRMESCLQDMEQVLLDAAQTHQNADMPTDRPHPQRTPFDGSKARASRVAATL